MANGELALDRYSFIDEDTELIRCIRSGDPDSFERLVEKYRPFVFGIIRNLVYDSSVEEDLAQEVFIQTYRGLNGFRASSKFKTWIYRITYNICLNHLRRSKKLSRCDYDVDFNTIKYDCLSPDAGHEKSELHISVGKIIRSLPEKYRSILYLHYYEDMQYEEIAQITGMPIGTVKSHLFRAREKMKISLEKAGWLSGGGR